jgi:anti-sigma regulatory factor (Ser/Thr protein kinase)
MSDTEPNRELRVTLPRDPSSVRVARHQVSSVLAAYGWDQRTEDVRLIVSELVTNAIQQDASDVELVMRFAGDALHLEVCDWGGRQPVRHDPSPDEPRGHGLNIVDRLADDWGTEVRGGRTRVWCDVRRRRLTSLR